MRKNITISLNQEDWQKVRAMARSLGETYSRIFHRLIASTNSMVRDSKRIKKYRSLLAPHGEYLAGRAGKLASSRL